MVIYSINLIMSQIEQFLSQDPYSQYLVEFKKSHLTKNSIAGKPFDFLTSYIVENVVFNNTKIFLESSL